LRDVPVPEGRDGAAKVRMRYSGVFRTGIGIVAGKPPRAQAPLVICHEFLGTIEQIQGGSGRVSPGDREGGLSALV